MGTKQNILVVGAGFSGSVIARELAEIDYNVTIIDQRNHIGGNCYDYIDDGLRIHKYGPHIFHTSNKIVFDWLSKFTTWIDYKHSVTALYNDEFFIFPPDNATLQLFDDKIYDIFYNPYTKKMWGEDVCSSVLKRVKSNNSTLYFPNDKYQAFPEHGYTKLFENILDHKNINVNLETSFSKEYKHQFYHIFNSMSIDEYYEFCYGELPYRSIKFYHTKEIEHDMPTPVVNYTTQQKYTRIVKWNLFPLHGFREQYTLEEPCDYKNNNYERYYPIYDRLNLNKKIYHKYKTIKNEKTTFIGRCGLYAYIDMDQAVSVALSTVKKFIKTNKI